MHIAAALSRLICGQAGALGRSLSRGPSCDTPRSRRSRWATGSASCCLAGDVEMPTDNRSPPTEGEAGGAGAYPCEELSPEPAELQLLRL